MVLQASIIETLRECTLFKGLTSVQVERIAALGEPKVYRAQEEVFRQGSLPQHLYVIVDGSVALVRNAPDAGSPPGAVWPVEMLGRGQGFAWAGVLGSHVHPYSALCQRETLLLALPAVELTALLQEDGPLRESIMKNLADTLAHQVETLLVMLDSRL